MELLKHYKILGEIGEGSFSKVLKVQHLKTKSIYAAKLLKKIYENEEEVQLCPEVSVMMKLKSHPNIVGIVEVICDPLPGKVSFILDLMDMSMYDYIKNRKRCLSELKVKNFLFQLTSGLQHLHNSGIFHRDIKPENILIKLEGIRSLDKKIPEVIQIADLGSSCDIFKNPPHTAYVSTRWYRAPECLLTSGYYGSKMDIWSLGCVFYEMLTLQPLFPGESRIDQLHKIHQILGSPSSNILSKFKHKDMEFSFPKTKPCGLNKLLPPISEAGRDVLQRMLTYLPDIRIDVNKIMSHKYFEDIRITKRIHSVKCYESTPSLYLNRTKLNSIREELKPYKNVCSTSRTKSLDTYFSPNSLLTGNTNTNVLKQKERAWGMNPGVAKTALVKGIQISAKKHNNVK